MRRQSRPVLQLFLFALCGILPAVESSAVTIITPAPENLSVRPPPPFAIAGMGIRHSLDPAFSSIYDVGIIIDGKRQSPVYDYMVTLVDGPTGMSVTPDGLVEWIPDFAAVGNDVACSFQIVVELDGVERFTALKEFDLRVVSELPSLVDQEHV
jgi:hypothetical protein